MIPLGRQLPDALFRAFGVGSGRNDCDLSQSVVPVVPVGLDARDIAARSHRAFFTMATQAAVAGVLSHVALHNPINSGVVVAIDSIEASIPAAGFVAFGLALDATSELGGAIVGVSSINLVDRQPLGVQIHANTNAAAQVNETILIYDPQAGFTIPRPCAQPILLRPRSSLVCYNPTVNQQIRAVFQGRVFPLVELTGKEA